MSEFEPLSYRLYEGWINNVEFILDNSVPNLLTPTTRILLIEPDRIEADTLKTVIENAGGKVTRVHDYQQTLSLIDLISPPDLILVSMSLPFLNSYRLIEYLRNTYAWRKLPIVAIFDRHDEFAINRAQQLGTDQCLVKPFSQQDLLNCINSTLNYSIKSIRSVA